MPRLKTLSYEDKNSFKEFVSCDYNRSVGLHSERRRREVAETIRKAGCRPIESGDIVNVMGKLEGAVGRSTTSTRPVGKVVSLNSSKNTVIVQCHEDGDCITGEICTTKCTRQPNIYALWYPESTPLLRHYSLLGLTSHSAAHGHRMQGIRDRAKWHQQVISQYKYTNLYLIASMLAGCATGSTGLILRNKLEDALIRQDIISSQHATLRSFQIDRLYSMFGQQNQQNTFPRESDIGQQIWLISIQQQHPQCAYSYDELMTAFGAVICGVGSDQFRRDCFDMYDSDGRGYIHREALVEWRRMRFHDKSSERERGASSHQVKLLLKLFIDLQKTEEVSKNTKKKGKGSKGEPPQSSYMKPVVKKHLNFEEFSAHIDSDAQLTLSFLPMALNILHIDSIGIKRFFAPRPKQQNNSSLPGGYNDFFVTS